MSVNLSQLGYLRVAAVSPSLRVGDVDFNVAMIVQQYQQHRQNGAQIILFPELAVVGYTSGDLLLQRTLLDAADDALRMLEDLVREQKGVVVVGAPIRAWGRLYNCAVIIGAQGIAGIVPKQYIPNYGEYYELRWFTRPIGDEPPVLHYDGTKVPFGYDLLFEASGEDGNSVEFGIELCEDLWSVQPPSQQLALAGAELLLNCSASNELLLKAEYRHDLVRMQSARCVAAYIYASAGAGESTTDTVFSGHLMIAENGVILAEDRAFSFESRSVCADVDIDRLRYERRFMTTFGQHRVPAMRRIGLRIPTLVAERPLRFFSASPFVPEDPDHRAVRCREVITIQRTGLAKRLRHTGLSSVVLGLSGGLDSTLALLVCIEAFQALEFDRRDIHAVIMPGPGSSQKTQRQAYELGTALGVDVQIIPITEAIEQHLMMLEWSVQQHDILFENAQARERTQILMDLCHKYKALMVGTSDLSELALGWTTYGGDHMSMYSVNAGVPKTLVKYIIQWWAETTSDDAARKALFSILETPISPELLPPNPDGSIRQRTEDMLGPYLVHDFFLYGFLRCGYGPSKLYATACWAFADMYSANELARWLQIFLERFFANQFKRSCLPDGPKIGTVALSPRADWRMPSDAEVSCWLRWL